MSVAQRHNRPSLPLAGKGRRGRWVMRADYAKIRGWLPLPAYLATLN